MSIFKRVVITDDEGEEREVKLPAEWEICSSCRGTGGSSAYLGAFTADEWREQDEDFQRDYMHGMYDRPCDCCHGGKLLVVSRERCTSREQRAALAWLDEQAADDAVERAMLQQEARLMGDCS